MDRKIAVVGLGYVCLPVAAAAQREYHALQPSQLRALVRGGQPVLVDVKSLYDRAAAGAVGFSVFRR